MRDLTGEQRLRQIKKKVDIIHAREMRAFLRGDTNVVRSRIGKELAAIAAEFERLAAAKED